MIRDAVRQAASFLLNLEHEVASLNLRVLKHVVKELVERPLERMERAALPLKARCQKAQGAIEEGVDLGGRFVSPDLAHGICLYQLPRRDPHRFQVAGLFQFIKCLVGSDVPAVPSQVLNGAGERGHDVWKRSEPLLEVQDHLAGLGVLEDELDFRQQGAEVRRFLQAVDEEELPFSGKRTR